MLMQFLSMLCSSKRVTRLRLMAVCCENVRYFPRERPLGFIPYDRISSLESFHAKSGKLYLFVSMLARFHPKSCLEKLLSINGHDDRRRKTT